MISTRIRAAVLAALALFLSAAAAMAQDLPAVGCAAEGPCWWPVTRLRPEFGMREGGKRQ